MSWCLSTYGHIWSGSKSVIVGCAVRGSARKVGKEALELAWKDFEHGGSGWNTAAVGGPGTLLGRELVDAPSWGLVRISFFLIVLVVCSDTYRSFGISSEYPFRVRKIFPSELS